MENFGFMFEGEINTISLNFLAWSNSSYVKGPIITFTPDDLISLIAD